MQSRISKIWKDWVVIAFLSIAFSGMVYLVVQQSIRQAANDPQIQMAEDTATSIAEGIPMQTLVPEGSVDIATSLWPYLVVFNASGTPVAGSGTLNGSLPSLPSGVLNNTLRTGEDRFTWQPSAGVRSAVVVVRINGSQGFVMAGRSLREIEMRENQLESDIGYCLLFILVGTFVLKILL